MSATLITWLRRHGPTWAYMLKVCLAAFLTYWLALELELPSPRTTLITVFIVMQPQSGSVIAKGAYRMLGTAVGLLVTVLLIAVFGQYGELYLACLALWVGLCCALSARQRNFTAYAFVLAGYTAAIVGLPALAHPEGVGLSAIWRAMEVGLAIVCSSLVAALVFPERAEDALRATLRGRFGAFNRLICDGLSQFDEGRLLADSRRFIGEAVRLENLRSLAVFEDPAVRQRSGRLQRLNAEFMMASSGFNALLRWLQHLRAQGREDLLAHLAPALHDLQAVLEPYQPQLFTAAEAGSLAAELEHWQQRWPRLNTHLANTLTLDELTAWQLLQRFVADLRDYALTHASLSEQVHAREVWSHPFAPSTAPWVSLAAGIRGSIVVAVSSLFWIATAYESGVPLVLSASAAVSLTAAAPDPQKAGLQMGLGALLGAVLGTLETFLVFPLIDGFALLCLVLAPVFMLGAWLTTRLQTFGIGLGMLIVFASGGVPDNLTVYDPAPFINDYIATILAFLFCAAASAVILPPNARWLWRHLQAQLRGQLRFALEGRLQAVRSQFESRIRDVLQHASGLSAGDPAVQQGLMRWWMSVQEVGHALLALRLEHPQRTLPSAWQNAGEALVQAFEQPSEAHRLAALGAVEAVLDPTQPATAAQSYWHFIRAALRDEQSPLVHGAA